MRATTLLHSRSRGVARPCLYSDSDEVVVKHDMSTEIMVIVMRVRVESERFFSHLLVSGR